MFFQRLRAMRRFQQLVAEGMEPEDAGEKVYTEFEAKGFDPAMLAAIMAFIQFLVELFSKK
jgi:hypothetical protein